MTQNTKQKEVAEVPQSVTLSKNITEISSKISKEKNQKERSVGQSQSPNISVCDVMKKNTSQVIKKVESQLPSNLQLYSDLYAEYLHMFDDVFGTCYISEKQFFDKLGIDQSTIKTFDKNSSVLTNFYSSQIDLASNYLRTYVQMRISAIKSYDKYMHVMMDSYAKMLSQFNSTVKN